MKRRFATITFNKSLNQDAPENILPLPFLTSVKNLVREKHGSLISRKKFVELSTIPMRAGEKPIKLFKVKNHLFAITDKRVFSYNQTQDEWSQLIIRQDMELNLLPVTQKEQDLKNVAFCRWANTLFCFYTFNNKIYYKAYSLGENRLVGEERLFPLQSGTTGDLTGTINGLYAWVETTRSTGVQNRLWLGILADNKRFTFQPTLPHYEPFSVSAQNFKPHWIFSTSAVVQHSVTAADRFVLYRDRCFYAASATSSTPASFIYNVPSQVKAGATDITSIRNPNVNAMDFTGTTLYDFYDWCPFSYGGEDFRIVWSLQTGFFVLNSTNNIVGHFYSNFTPYSKSTPARMVYMGEAFTEQSKVYIPVLRSGQAEQIAGGDIEYPLGLELLVLNFAPDSKPEVAIIDNQTMISGPVVRYTDEQNFVERDFSKRPVITKTDTEDYDRWAYGDRLERSLPTPGSLADDQFSEFNTSQVKKNGPYMIADVGITAGAVDVNGTWDASTTTQRTLRYSSDLADGTSSDTYGLFDKLRYSATDKALIAEFNVTKTLAGDDGDIQGITIDGRLYEFMYFSRAGAVLSCYHFTDSNPLTAGTKYNVRAIGSEVLRPQNAIDFEVQQPTASNDSKSIKVNDIRLRRFYRHRVNSTLRAERQIGADSVIDFGKLNHLDWMGAFKTAGDQTAVGVPANSGGTGVSLGSISNEDVVDAIDLVGVWPDRRTTTTTRQVNTGRLRLARASGKDLPARNFAFVWNGIGWQDQFGDTGSTTRTFWAYNLGTKQRSPTNDVTFYVGPRGIQYNTGFAAGNSGEYAYIQRAKGGSGRDRRDAYLIAYSLRTKQAVPSRDIDTRQSDNSVVVGDGTRTWWSDGRGVLRGDVNNWAGVGSAPNLDFASGDGHNDAFVRNNIFYTKTRAGNSFIAYNAITGARMTSADTTGGRVGSAGSSGLNYWDNVLYYAGGSGVESWDVSDAQRTETDTNVVDGGNFYLAFKAPLATYSSNAAFQNDFKAKVTKIRFSEGTQRYTMNVSDLASGDYRQFTTSASRYMVANLNTELAASAILRGFRDSGDFNMGFRSPAGQTYNEVRTEIEPVILSVTYNSNKVLDEGDITDDLIAYNSEDLSQLNSFILPAYGRVLSKGPTAGRTYYYKRTHDNPLTLNAQVFNFVNPVTNILFRYLFVRLAVSTGELLKAEVYRYKCRYKWIDENGVEFLSQFSDTIQLLTNTPVGRVGNQPTFSVKYLNLTNKLEGSVSIDIYRTENRLSTFKLVKNIPNDREAESGIVTDDVEDENLGQVAGPSQAIISGARHILDYRGHFVLYGFPEKAQRIIISSARRPFTNFGISFNTQDLPGDMIELLLESPVQCVRAMDQYLIIFTETGTFAWTIRPDTLIQPEPVEVTGLVDITAKDSLSAIKVSDGLVFLTPANKFWSVSRGLSSEYVGAAIQDFRGDVISITTTQDAEESRFATSSADYPVLVYNYRFKEWSVLNEAGLVSTLIWEGYWCGVKSNGEFYSESDIPLDSSREFSFETGYFNLAKIKDYQRIREFILLAKFTGLESLGMTFLYDGGETEGETIYFDLTGYNDSPYLQGGPIETTSSLRDKVDWRFQPRVQRCSSIKIRVSVRALSAQFDALRIGYIADVATRGTSYLRGAKQI